MDSEHEGTLLLQQALLRRVLAAHDGGRLHLRFRSEVIDRYRGRAEVRLLRTHTVGRIAAGRWSVDVGIAPDGVVHLPLQDLIDRLPEAEWAHWIEHLVVEPLSAAFLQMRMTAGACIDDGETVAW